MLRRRLEESYNLKNVSGLLQYSRLLLNILHMLSLLFLHLSFSQDSELSYAHRDGRLLELIDEAWQKDELPHDGTKKPLKRVESIARLPF